MKNNKKPLLVISILVLVIATIVLIMSFTGHNKVTVTSENNVKEQKPVSSPYLDRVADVEPIELPSEVAADVGFEPKAVDTLTERFVLRQVEKGDNSIIYYYQTHQRTDGERLMLICNAMSEDDYIQGLPKLNYENNFYNDLKLTYMERSLLYVPDGYEISEATQANIDRGILVVEYGNDLEELMRISSVSWYENGIKYELQVRNNNVTEDELIEMAKLVINS